MAKNYQWSTTTDFDSDTDMSYGVIPNDTSWHTTTAGDGGSATASYYYRDANVSSGGQYTDANSSRVITSVTNSWTSSVSDLNVLTISLNTTINSIDRDDLRGVNQDTPGRNITIYNSSGTVVFGTYTDTQLASAHSISGSINVGSTTIVLQPGQNASLSALQLHNQTVGGSSYDDIGIGVRFRNPLPSPTTYTLSYDANGGTGAPSAQSTTTGEASVTYTVASGTPTWGSYKFLGWSHIKYTDSRTETDVEYRAGDSITLTQSSPSMTLYAVWEMDYRPGSVYNGTNDWLSHNRTTGQASVYNGSSWLEMRTINGAVGTGNPPEIRDSSTYHNMRKIGTE